jgi:prepilin-type N-terminal cleavage/methylation domain-containing protein
MLMARNRHVEKGFTLIELLVVIAIVGIFVIRIFKSAFSPHFQTGANKSTLTALKLPQTGPDQGLRKRKNWAALVVLTETLKTAPLTVTTLVKGLQRLPASRLRALSTLKPV